MGVIKRWIWMGLMLVFCILFGGCRKEVAQDTVTQTVSITEMSAESAAEVAGELAEEMPEAEATVTPTSELKPEAIVAPTLNLKPEATAVPTAEPKPVATVVPTPEPKHQATAEPASVPKSGTTTEPTSAPILQPAATAIPSIHVHDIAVETQAATCLEAGQKREYCKTCKDVLAEESLPALGHDYIPSVWELPTCQKGGYYNNVCSRCGLVECVTQNPLPHEVVDITVQEGNCMEDTVIQHKCKVCGLQVESDTRYTNYEAHKWMREVIDGAEVTYCDWCGVSK